MKDLLTATICALIAWSGPVSAVAAPLTTTHVITMSEAKINTTFDLNQVNLSEEDKARFWSKVEKGDGDSCWLWTGGQFRKPGGGYGAFHINRIPRQAHRVSFLLHHGSVPVELRVLHRCDVRLCVRPDHLFLGTDKDNSDDKVAKGRQSRGAKHSLAKLPTAARGESNGNAKLTPDDVREIRRLHAGGMGQLKIAKLFGMSKCPISLIVSGRTWKHIT
jgi:hypothetical protein